MNTSRSTYDMPRFADIEGADTTVLTASNERSMLQELSDCKRKLAEALSGIEGIEIPADAGPQATAQKIAEAYAESGPEQARLGAVYRRYCELRGKLAMANLKLVAHVAKRFRERGIPYADLLQEGFCGLLEAIDRFDMSHQTKLATYATWWIRQSMQRAVASGAYPVRLTPRHLRQLAHNQFSDGNKPNGERDANAPDSSREPRNALIERIHTATQPTVSLDAIYGPDSGFSLIQTMSDPDGDKTLDVDAEETIKMLMGHLRPREQEVLTLRFGLSGSERLSLTQVGKILEVSKERVRQIEEKSLKKLRSAITRQACRGHLDFGI